MKKGYKSTEIGVIPKDWELKTINDIGTFSKGKGIKKDEVMESGFPCVRYGELYTHYDNVIKDFKSFISLETSKESKKIKNGDILFAGSGETKEDIGKSACVLSDKDVYVGGDVIILTPNNTNSIFLGYLFNSIPVKNQKSKKGQGDAVVHIYSKGIKTIKVPLPPTLKEQQAIASVLSDTDSLLNSLKILIAKKKAIKQGTMQELLTGKKRLKGFTRDWETTRLEDTIENVIDNRGKTPPLSITGIPLLEVNSIYKQGKNPNYSLVSKYVSTEIYNTWFRAHPKDKDILIVTVGSAGTTSFFGSKIGCIAQNLISVRINNYYCSAFIFYLTKTRLFMDKVKSVLMGGVQPSLKVPHINNFEFIIPKNIKEQQAIAQILTDMDTEIEALENQLQKTENLKQGLMQELLTGKIRLVQPTIENKLGLVAEPRASYGK